MESFTLNEGWGEVKVEGAREGERVGTGIGM